MLVRDGLLDDGAADNKQRRGSFTVRTALAQQVFADLAVQVTEANSQDSAMDAVRSLFPTKPKGEEGT